MEQRRRCVADRNHGTLEPVSPKLDGRCRTSVAQLPGEVGNPWLSERAHDLVVGRQPPAGHSAGHHLHVAQDRGAALQGSACRRDHTGGEGDIAGQVKLQPRSCDAADVAAAAVGDPFPGLLT